MKNYISKRKPKENLHFSRETSLKTTIAKQIAILLFYCYRKFLDLQRCCDHLAASILPDPLSSQFSSPPPLF